MQDWSNIRNPPRHKLKPLNPYAEFCLRFPRLLETQIWQRGGFICLQNFPGAESLRVMQDEANEYLAAATRQEWPHENDADWRGGQPTRHLSGASAGPALNNIFRSEQMLEVIGSLLSTPVRMAGGGSLTLYNRPGDGLGLHRDVDLCDVTLVTCLHDSRPLGVLSAAEGSLRAYPEFCHEPLSAIPEEREQLGISIGLRAGDAAVLLGGIVPHEVTPMAAGQCRVVSLVCYELIDMGN